MLPSAQFEKYSKHDNVDLLTSIIPKVMVLVAQHSSRNPTQFSEAQPVLANLPPDRVPTLCQGLLDELCTEGYDPLSMSHNSLVREIGRRINSLTANRLHALGLSDNTKDRPINKLEEQISLEIRALRSTIDRYRLGHEAIKNAGHGAEQAPVRRLLLSWYEPLVRVIKEEQERAKDPNHSDKIFASIAERIVLLGAPEISIIVIHEVMNKLLLDPNSGVTVLDVSAAVGNVFNNEVAIQSIKSDKAAWGRLKKEAPRRLIPMINAKNKNVFVSKPDTVAIGAFFIDLLLKTAQIDTAQGIGKGKSKEKKLVPAFERFYVNVNEKHVGKIKCHDAVSKFLENDFAHSEQVEKPHACHTFCICMDIFELVLFVLFIST
jgi:DNA-directed RNA polymerase